MAPLMLSRRYFIALSLLLLAFVVGWLFYSYMDIKRQILQDNHFALLSELHLRKSLLQDRLTDSLRHVEFLYKTPPVKGMLRATENKGVDPLDGTPYKGWVGRLETIFEAYLATNSTIRQARFIGVAEGGRELVRVHRHGDAIEVVPHHELQRKGNRDYFLDAQKLQHQDVHISPINLNREFGKIEQPPWPTYRVIRPVFDSQNQFFGIIVVNFDASSMLQSLAPEQHQKLNVFLLDDQGRYLYHPDASKAFAWEFDDHGSWLSDSKYNPSVLLNHYTELMHSGIERQLLAVADKIVGLGAGRDLELTLIVTVQKALIDSQVLQRQLLAAMVDFSLGFVIFLLLYIYYRLSEKTREERKLRAEIQAVFDGTSSAILSISCAGIIRSWNNAAIDVFKVSESQISHGHLQNIVLENDGGQKLNQCLEALWHSGKHTSIDLTIVTPSKKSMDLHLSVSPIRGAENRITGAALIFYDISKAIILQKKLAQLNEQLEDRNTEMEKFIYSVSHDLKAPLVTISAFTDKVIQTGSDTLNEKNKHRLNRILINTQNMAEVLDELLRLSKIAREELKIKACRVSDCITQACDSLSQQIVEKGASISSSDNDYIIVCNAKLVTTCLQNLISNAIQYRDPERHLRIIIKTERRGDVLRVSVADNGLGIDEKYHSQIFKIFERLDVGEGHGVGLAIVKSIVEKHAGWVELESEPGLGSKFTMCFPNQRC